MKTIEIYVNIQKCTSVNVHKVYHMFTTRSHIVKEKKLQSNDGNRNNF